MRTRSKACGVGSVSVACCAAVGQCNSHWLAPIGTQGPGYDVDAIIVWDPDGAGPAAPELVVGGTFLNVGGMYSPGMATWDGTGWHAWAVPLNPSGNETLGLAVVSGDLYASDGFDIGRWDVGSQSWSLLPSVGGLELQVHTLGVYNGALVAGGEFTLAGGTVVNHIARWNATAGAWEAFGGGLTNSDPYPIDAIPLALATYHGDLWVGGGFDRANGIPVQNIARWDGTAWHSPGWGCNDWVAALLVYNDRLIIGGTFTTAGNVGAARIVRWDGASLQALAPGFNDAVHALTTRGDELFAAGGFTSAGATPVSRIARWRDAGGGWSGLDEGISASFAPSVFTLCEYKGTVTAGGRFERAGTDQAWSIAQWGCSTECYANCDNSTTAPALNVNDFICFLNRFAAGDAYANCDTSTTPPTLNVNDFICFLNRFAAGCP